MNQREIKFRAWDKKKKRMYSWEKIASIHNNGIIMISENDGDSMLMPKNIILLQFTGLKDSKGVEIYEGDIVKSQFFSNRIVFKVVWCDMKSGFCLEVIKNGGRCISEASTMSGGIYEHHLWGNVNGIGQYLHPTWIQSLGKLKVIGNIFENPELLSERARPQSGIEPRRGERDKK
jgi:uncharacterized phage protein (TIGR01671 family)